VIVCGRERESDQDIDGNWSREKHEPRNYEDRDCEIFFSNVITTNLIDKIKEISTDGSLSLQRLLIVEAR